VRAGAQTLTLLSAPLNVHVLKALEEQPRSLIDLRRVVGRPPQTTMRGHLKALTELGVLERRRRPEFPGSVDFELGAPGRDLLAVADVVEAWLRMAPEGPQSLGDLAAKSSIKALVEGWSATVVRAIAAAPLTLTELSKLISSLNYPSLERRLVAMRLAGQIEGQSGQTRGTPYVATRWLRHAVAPLMAAARWERQNARETAPQLTRIDVEAMFLLSAPLVERLQGQSGTCRFTVDVRNSEGEVVPVGVVIQVSDGRVVSCSSRIRGHVDAWASGSVSSWFGALIDQDIERLEMGGDCGLGLALLDGMHSALFGARTRV
jgi:DNA-binding HxlR family transcriptional regulator